MIFKQENQLHIGSGDEYAYEYVKNEGAYFINTINQKGILVLPPQPVLNFKIIVSDHYGSWKYYPLIIHRNGHRIMGSEENMICDIPNAIFALEFIADPNVGWVVHHNLTTNTNTELYKGINRE